MNWYLAAYASVCCALLGFIVMRYSRGTAQIRPRWSNVLLWAVASAFSAVVIWSILWCLLLPVIEAGSHFRVGFLPTCIAISG